MVRTSERPDWDRLYETASAQAGYFTTKQAAEAGYSSQLLVKHIRAGRVARTRRGIYRLVHFPASEYEDLVTAWLWSDRKGVLSHQTALVLHRLSDVLPAQVHLTLPAGWSKRRFRLPEHYVVHHADVFEKEREWFGAVPITNPRRTLSDCVREGLSPDLLRQAAHQALSRGLVTRTELGTVEKALELSGGLEP